MVDQTERRNITGRDGVIIGQALVMAIKYNEGLPREEQAPSDVHDMHLILSDRYPRYAEMYGPLPKDPFLEYDEEEAREEGKARRST